MDGEFNYKRRVSLLKRQSGAAREDLTSEWLENLAILNCFYLEISFFHILTILFILLEAI